MDVGYGAKGCDRNVVERGWGGGGGGERKVWMW